MNSVLSVPFPPFRLFFLNIVHQDHYFSGKNEVVEKRTEIGKKL